jgi:hypothetical protein
MFWSVMTEVARRHSFEHQIPGSSVALPMGTRFRTTYGFRCANNVQYADAFEANRRC